MNSAATIKQELQDDLRRATRTIGKRLEKCIEVDGGIFEHFELLQFFDIIYITKKCNQQVICLSFIPFVRVFYAYLSNTPIESWTHFYMNLFTRNSPYYHLLKYLLFLLKHPVCIY
jgi:hypothetical protein